MKKYFLFNLFLFLIFAGFSAKASSKAEVELSLTIAPVDFLVEVNTEKISEDYALNDIKIISPASENNVTINITSEDKGIFVETPSQKNFNIINGLAPKTLALGETGKINQETLGVLSMSRVETSSYYIVNNLKLRNITQANQIFLTIAGSGL